MINLLGGGLLPPTFYTRSRDLGPSDPWSLTKNLNYETVDNSVRKTTTTTFPPNAEFFLPETPNFWRPGSNTIKLFLPQLNCHKITSRFWFIVWDLQWVFKWAWDLNLRLQETNDGKCRPIYSTTLKSQTLIGSNLSRDLQKSTQNVNICVRIDCSLKCLLVP